MTRTTCDLCETRMYPEEVPQNLKEYSKQPSSIMSYFYAYGIFDICPTCLEEIHRAECGEGIQSELFAIVRSYCTKAPQETPSNETILSKASADMLLNALLYKENVEIFESSSTCYGQRDVGIRIYPQEENE